jgi:hypothetical protein
MLQRIFMDKTVDNIYIEQIQAPGEFIIMPLGIANQKEVHFLKIINIELLNNDFVFELTSEQSLLLIRDILEAGELMGK